jgi:hypothetical protein
METNMTTLRVLALAVLTASGAALAQSDEPAPAPPRNNAIVYKCVNADGSVVYAQDPCSTDPKKMVTLDTSGALRTGSGGHQDEISAGVADSDCRDNAYRSTHSASEAKVAESNTHINDYRQRVAALQSQGSYGGAVDPGTAKAIDDLEAAIARESEFQQKEVASAALAFDDALKVCDQQRRNGRVPTGESEPPPAPAPAPSPPPPASDNGGG